MAAIGWKYRNVKAGIRVEGKVKLSCGHTLKEYATARTEANGRQVVERLLITLTADHARECGK